MVAVGDAPVKDHGLGVMDLIASDAVLDDAYAWLSDRRKTIRRTTTYGHCEGDGPTSSSVAEKSAAGRVPL